MRSPALVRDYVRTGKVSMQFENLSFIGPGSVPHAALQRRRLSRTGSGISFDPM